MRGLELLSFEMLAHCLMLAEHWEQHGRDLGELL